MDFKIITDNENPLFNRREIQGEIHTEINPSREEVIKLISEKTKISAENIKIKTIQAKFGSKVFIIVANIYSSPSDKKKIERMSKKEKEAEEKSKKQSEEPAAQEIPEQQESEVKEEDKNE